MGAAIFKILTIYMIELYDRKITFRRGFIKYASCILDNPKALKLNLRIIIMDCVISEIMRAFFELSFSISEDGLHRYQK
jgi:hypothetical protein